MDDKIQDQIKAEIVGEDLSLDELESRYPEYDRWDLRILRSEALKDNRLDTVINENQTSKLPPPIKKDLPKSTVSVIESGFIRPVNLEYDCLPPAQPMFERAGTQILIGSDMHFPLGDPHAMDVFYQIGRAVDPDWVIIDGDLFDVNALSKYDKPHTRPLRWVDERQQALPDVVNFRSNFPGTKISLVLGNHDKRPMRWIDKKATPLQGLFTIGELLGISDLGFEITDEPILLANDQLIVKHGTTVSKHSAYSVKKEVEAAGLSVIMGHVHRRGVHEVTKTRHKYHNEDPLIGMEIGCLCDLNPHYLEDEDTSNWQHGACLVTIYPGGTFGLEMIRINRGKASFRGREFRSRIVEEDSSGA